MRHMWNRWLNRWQLSCCIAIILGLLVPTITHAQTNSLSRPKQEYIAYGQLAVVRILSTYYGQSGATLIPIAIPCTGIGTLITTSPSAVLTDSSIINSTQPCQSVVAAYDAQYHAQPDSWHILSVTAYLNAAYTSSQPNIIGATDFPLDITTNLSLGLQSGPVVLPFLHEPAYSLPVVPIAAQTTHGGEIIDLRSVDGQVQSAVSTAPDTLTIALTPVTVDPESSKIQSLGIGSPILSDATNGMAQLTGMIIMSTHGPMFADITTITKAASQAQLAYNNGDFSLRWHSALHTYYAAQGNAAAYAKASQEFTMLLVQYPYFQGVISWLIAAQAGLPAIEDTVNNSTTEIIPGIPIHSTVGLAILGIATIIVLLGLIIWFRSAITGRQRKSPPVPVHEDSLAPLHIDHTGPVPAVNQRASADTVPESQRSQPLTRTVPLPRNRRMRRFGLLASALTHPGIRRRADPNQDNILAVKGARLHDGAPQSFGLFIVADGMGGHQFGREASSRTIEVMMEHIIEPLLNGQPMKEDELLELLRTSVEEANAEIHRRNVSQNADMGTTVTAALVTGDIAHIVNVGDSRTYHLPVDAQLQQVTADHSVVASLVAAGVIQPEDIYTHPKRNQIYRSLGEREDVQVDVFQVLLQEGDRIILCSDGLWEMVRDPRIEEIVRSDEDPREVAKMLIDEANRNGGVDNISAVVIGIQRESAPTQTGAEIIAAPDTMGKKLH